MERSVRCATTSRRAAGGVLILTVTGWLAGCALLEFPQPMPSTAVGTSDAPEARPDDSAMQLVAAEETTELFDPPSANAPPAVAPVENGRPIPAYPEMVPLGPVAPFDPRPVCPPPVEYSPVLWRKGVACGPYGQCEGHKPPGWSASQPIPFQMFAQGEYVGPARLPHVPEYRVRVDDTIDFVFRLTREKTSGPYRLEVGDTMRMESLTDATLNREIIVEPDGTITVPQIGQVPAAGLTLPELQAAVEQGLKPFVPNAGVTISPIRLNTRLEEFRSSIINRFVQGGQVRQVHVTPEGTIQLPTIGSVPAQGLTLQELQMEVQCRYRAIIEGIEATPILVQRAPRFVYVIGEVGTPGRFPLEGPTTAMMAISMAGGWKIGAKLNHIVILRRDNEWNLMATKLKLHNALFGLQPCPTDEIWLRDSDVVIVPKRPIQWTGDLIEMYLTRGLYGVVPIFYSFALKTTGVL